MMELKDIASVSGKGGLFTIVKPSRTGFILESLDDKKKKVIAHGHDRVSVLEEIAIYTNDSEGSVPLKKVFQAIHEEFGTDTGIDNKSSKEELMAFLKHILPNYDENQVYPSDVKKLVNWYEIILERAPEVFKDQSEDKKEDSN